MRIGVFISLVALLFSCESSEYSSVSHQIKKKLEVFGDGEKEIGDSDYLDLNFGTSVINDEKSVYKENHLFLSDFDSSIFGNKNLGKDINTLVTGDSVIYRMPYSVLKNSILDLYIDNQVILSDSQTVTLFMRCNLSMGKDEYLAYREEQVQKGLAIEMELIEEYILKENLGGKLARKGDLFYMKIKEMNSEKVNISDDLAIAYSCRFLNGVEFNKVDVKSPLFLNLSSPSQVIPGIESILKEMNEGEFYRIIIPSYLGFGEDGSSDGTVPAHTPIIADVQVVEILS